MKFIVISQFFLISLFGFSQERTNHTYKFNIQSITSYSQAKPFYDQIRMIFSESKSVNHLLIFDSGDATFKVQSTINFDRESLQLELEKIGLTLREFNVDGKLEE
jgi:hypothetical protein